MMETSDSSDDSTVAVQGRGIAPLSQQELPRKRRGAVGNNGSTPLLWTRCTHHQVTVELNFKSSSEPHDDVTTTRVMWHDEGVGGRSRSELDCFLLCFPTQLIPSICHNTTSAFADDIGPDISATIESLTEAELLRHISILLAASVDSTALEQSSLEDLWSTQPADHNTIRLPSFFGDRFGMTLERFSQINKNMKLGSNANHHVYIKQLLDGFNHKRKSAILPADSIRIDDIIAIFSQPGSDVVNSAWVQDVNWNAHPPIKLLGVIKALTDVQSGICVGMNYVKVDDITVAPTNVSFRERTRDAILAMGKPFVESGRTLYVSEKEIVSLQNVTALAERGINIVANVTTGFEGLQVHSDWHTMGTDRNSSVLLAKAPLRLLPSSSENGLNDQLYLFMPGNVARDILLFNAGSTVNVVSHRHAHYFFGSNPDSGVPEVLAKYQKAIRSRNDVDLAVSCRDGSLSVSSALVAAIFNAVVVQSAIDAFHVFSHQGQTPLSSWNLNRQLRVFISRLTRALLDKSGEHSSFEIPTAVIGTMATASIPVLSVPVASVNIASQSNTSEATNMMLQAQDQHRLLPLSKLPYYSQYREANKRAKRRCRICHHPTGYYCACCSNLEQGSYFALCHPTTKPDSRCYFEHFQG